MPMVRDEQGRRRFHGAFTGGYSAGYYNTVGSKEGWTPSEFVSSRDKRSERKVMKPEDFMDEEDKQMLADSARLMATSDFDTAGSTRRDIERKRAAARSMQTSGSVLGALPDSLIDDIIVPSSEPVGIRLLKRMGWKSGQGIGPRVSRRQKKPEDGGHSDEDDEHLANVTFAPIDSAVVVFINKTNHQGLGFDPYKHAPEFDRSLQARTESKYQTKEPQGKRTGFGFGKFDDDDDEDGVYGSGPSILQSLDYDPALNDRPRSRRDDNKEKEKSRIKPDTMVAMYCSDGRPPLAGFVLASTPAKAIKWYSAPQIPKDFVPHHTFDDDVKPILPTNKREQPKLTADDRAFVLGETPIDGPRRSVFEYISGENKNRLDNLLGFVMDTEGDKRLRKDHWEVPTIDKHAAEAALKGFMPFGDNIAKQNRYKQYLNVQAGISEEKIELVEGFSGQDMMKELSEFVQAARIFKPLASTMANRFTSASKIIEFAQPVGGLRSMDDIKATEKTAPLHHPVERMEVPKSQAAKAAAMGMFGPLTRTVVDFYPAKLLCKRFNVPNPHPDHKDTGPEPPKDLLDKNTMDRMVMERRPGEGITGDDILETSHGSSSSLAKEVPAEVVAEEENMEQHTEEVQERPSMDIFKAIFDNSDTESESESDIEDDRKEPAPVRVEAQKADSAATVIDKQEETPQGPFRPMFTRKSDRTNMSSSVPPSRVQSRSNKTDLSHLKDMEDDDDSEIGPKLTIPRATTEVSKRPADDKMDNINGVKKIRMVPDHDGPSSPDDFIGPPPPAPGKQSLEESGSEAELLEEKTPSSRHSESHSSKRYQSSSSSHRESHSSSRHKSTSSSSSSRQKSSSSRSDRRDRHSSSSSRRRSSSRSKRRPKHHGSSGEESEDPSDIGSIDANTDDKERRRRSGHSSSSKSKSKRHRSRSRSKSPSSRSHKRDKDRDQDRERSSKRSRSERHKSKHRDGRQDKEEEDDMDDMWVEKEVDIPAPTVSSASEPKQAAPPTNRPRATSFF
ncbi:MAG: hypothetical protein J3Q66DRAFT_165653 [Benniella sp.]|nr:MAG: hypothetical protein J3Q66DRAFT_165653 [Benniella sp.]